MSSTGQYIDDVNQKMSKYIQHKSNVVLKHNHKCSRGYNKVDSGYKQMIKTASQFPSKICLRENPGATTHGGCTERYA